VDSRNCQTATVTPAEPGVYLICNYQSNVERSILEQEVLQERGDYIYILVLQNFIFFGTANALIENLCQRLKNQPQIQYVVLDFSSVTGLDSSAIHSFFKLNHYRLEAGRLKSRLEAA
jgi:MFS superfamily sulfate permease-like transporter